MPRKLTEAERIESIRHRREYQRVYMRAYRSSHPDRVMKSRVAQARRLLARYTAEGGDAQ